MRETLLDFGAEPFRLRSPIPSEVAPPAFVDWRFGGDKTLGARQSDRRFVNAVFGRLPAAKIHEVLVCGLYYLTNSITNLLGAGVRQRQQRSCHECKGEAFHFSSLSPD
jgi:hypothetical protein